MPNDRPNVLFVAVDDLRWHRADPPDAEERRRNDVIADLRGRRNPFIDDPARADQLHFEVPGR